jgi:hypothetical protein
MGNRLEDFRLVNYEERSRLLSALDLYRKQWGSDEELDALVLRLSRTECQPGGCEYCNEDRAREESERRDAEYEAECETREAEDFEDRAYGRRD